MGAQWEDSRVSLAYTINSLTCSTHTVHLSIHGSSDIIRATGSKCCALEQEATWHQNRLCGSARHATPTKHHIYTHISSRHLLCMLEFAGCGVAWVWLLALAHALRQIKASTPTHRSVCRDVPWRNKCYNKVQLAHKQLVSISVTSHYVTQQCAFEWCSRHHSKAYS